MPINMLVVTASVTNKGKSAVHRLKGISRSDSSMLREKELLFGKVEPGATISRDVKIRLPYFPRAQDSIFSLELSDGSDKVISTGSERLKIKGRQRPAFSYTATLENAEEKSLGRLEENTEARLALRIT
ncbi:MAG: hypothetical protein MK554_04210, partial [Planctomycetes bacterium]|nr:hypothetical protein [Planctomycetota bacterium]